jgi:hypothetical protein
MEEVNTKPYQSFISNMSFPEGKFREVYRTLTCFWLREEVKKAVVREAGGVW